MRSHSETSSAFNTSLSDPIFFSDKVNFRFSLLMVFTIGYPSYSTYLYRQIPQKLETGIQLFASNASERMNRYTL